MDMIRPVLELIRDRLNDFFQDIDRRSDGWVILSNPVGRDGRAVEAAKNKVVMALANITSNRTARASMPSPGHDAIGSPPLHVDLLIVFFANFEGEHYAEGLSVISRTIGFFQQTPVWTLGNLPGLDPSIDKLTLELINLDLTELRNLMEMMGTGYLPAVIYRLRTISVRCPCPRSAIP